VDRFKKNKEYIVLEKTESNTGEGASTQSRATWSKQLKKKEAAEYTTENIRRQ
jgi:hypothetical protein